MKSAVILAAGTGSRFGGDKLSQMLLGKPVLQWSVEAFLPVVDEVVIVTDNDEWKQLFPFAKFVKGGQDRHQSVKNGLLAISKQSALVAIHDGARPYASTKLIQRLFDTAKQSGSAIPVGPIHDTVYNLVEFKAVDRAQLRAVQTPQVFDTQRILYAYEAFPNAFTDDSQVYKAAYGELHFVENLDCNVKITQRCDLPTLRTGVGYDVHQLVQGRPLVLGGKHISFDKGLLGHSDADVLTHAVMDALLSASGNKDIGHQFPDTDDAYKDASSIVLLQKVAQLLHDDGWEVLNVSATVMAQQPKLAPHLDEMASNLANALGICASQVAIAATTTETLGIVGEGRGMACHSSVLIKRG
ncbi:MAG: 2-C-methyl-D-erythritol 2,4-cyclodiphosphate synthase [Clostridia bacterium]|nr:2-C-methyl-D-erythritol 2,4-cyclodiphosphate synthase [Clostridia bacterium]